MDSATLQLDLEGAWIPITRAYTETANDGAERMFVSGPVFTESRDYQGQILEGAGIMRGLQMGQWLVACGVEKASIMRGLQTHSDQRRVGW